jgi:hypothetical protein
LHSGSSCFFFLLVFETATDEGIEMSPCRAHWVSACNRRNQKLESRRRTEEERGREAGGHADLRTRRDNSIKSDGCRREQQTGNRKKHRGSCEIVSRRGRRYEALGKHLGGFGGARLGKTDLGARASSGTEPGDLGFDRKQRDQQAKHNTQCRQSRMPDQETSSHIQ